MRKASAAFGSSQKPGASCMAWSRSSSLRRPSTFRESARPSSAGRQSFSFCLYTSNSIFIAILFFGGYLSPFGKYLFSNSFLIYFEQAFWLFLKASLIIFIMIWVRATLPRLASFDLLKFSWAYLLPISILNLFAMVLIKFGGQLC